MKISVIFLFAIISNLIYIDYDEYNQYIFKNNFKDEINLKGRALKSLFHVGHPYESIFKILDTCKYKNKNIKFLLDDLSKKYIYLDGVAFNGVLGLDNNDFTLRTHFVLEFQYQDTLSLNIVGIISKDNWFYENSDSIAFNRIIEIDSYLLLPLIYNKKEQYKEIIEILKSNNDSLMKNTIEELLRKYPEVAK